MKELDILIIENDSRDIELYKDAVLSFNNESKNYKIIPTVKTSKEEGLASLENNTWIAAFVDLKLSSGDILNAKEGNEIVGEIYQKRRYPIYILTNTPSDVSYTFKESIFLKIASKDEVNYYDCLIEIINIYKTGILNILGKKGSIDKYIDDIFWNNLSHSLEEWFNIENCEKHLLRYTLSHFQQYLEISEEGIFEEYHPMETYIYPSIKKPIFTGDIISFESKEYIVLTPACDLAPHGNSKPKATHVLLAEIEDYSSSIISGFVKKIIKLKNTNSPDSKVEENLLRLIKNNYADQYFYLPESKLFKGGLVNFRKLRSVKIKELSEPEIICYLNAPFIKDVIARLSFYYARQGAPDFSFTKLYEKHINIQ